MKLYDVKLTSNNIYIVTEFCDGGDLLNYFLKKGCRLTEEEVRDLLIQIAEGFREMKKHSIVHRDLKPANILMHQGKIKIGDLGFSKCLGDHKSFFTGTCLGTPLYMAPQVLMKQTYSDKVDIWSFGVIAYQLLFNDFPWHGRDMNTLSREISTKLLNFPEKRPISPQMQDLITRCLKIYERERLSWDEVLAHPVINISAIAQTSPTHTQAMAPPTYIPPTQVYHPQQPQQTPQQTPQTPRATADTYNAPPQKENSTKNQYYTVKEGIFDAPGQSREKRDKTPTRREGRDGRDRSKSPISNRYYQEPPPDKSPNSGALNKDRSIPILPHATGTRYPRQDSEPVSYYTGPSPPQASVPKKVDSEPYQYYQPNKTPSMDPYNTASRDQTERLYNTTVPKNQTGHERLYNTTTPYDQYSHPH